MQLKQLLRRRRVVVPLVATVAVALGAGIAFAGASSGDTYTGCLKRGGTIVKVAIGDNPKKPCGSRQTEISWNQEGQPGMNGSPGTPGIVPPAACPAGTFVNEITVAPGIGCAEPSAGDALYERSDTQSGPGSPHPPAVVSAKAECDAGDWPVSMRSDVSQDHPAGRVFADGSFLTYPLAVGPNANGVGATANSTVASATAAFELIDDPAGTPAGNAMLTVTVTVLCRPASM